MKPGRIHPGAGTGVVVIHDGCLLMIERAGSDGAGTWSVPGGWVELWEHPLDCAVREVAEETDIVVSNPREAGWTNAPHHETGVHSITLWVRATYHSGTPTVVEPEKCPRVEWVPLGEVLDRPLFSPLGEWWPEQPEAIVQADEFLGALLRGSDEAIPVSGPAEALSVYQRRQAASRTQRHYSACTMRDDCDCPDCLELYK